MTQGRRIRGAGFRTDRGRRLRRPPGGCRPAPLVLGLALLGACAAPPAPPVDEVGYRTVERDFNLLCARWDREAAAVRPPATREEYWRGSAGLEILSLGKVALPFVMEQIREGNFYFNYAAERITGLPVGYGLKQEADRSWRWMEWWAAHRADRAWNVFVR